MFIQDGRLHWEHNWFGEEHFLVSSDEALPTGAQVVSAHVAVDEEGDLGGGGTVTLRTGDTVIGQGRFDKQVPFRFTTNETFDVGCDTVTAVSDRYEAPFPFTGTLLRAMVDVSGASFEELALDTSIRKVIDDVKSRIAMALQ